MNHNKYESPLSSRYASQEMQYIFSPDKKFSTWHRLWIALARAEMELGLPVTQAQVSQLEAHVDDIDYEAAARYEKELRHDVMAHIHAYGDQCPDAMPIIHLGATSCYVGDNTDVILMREGLMLVRDKLVRVLNDLAKFADTYKALPTLGFTHFQAAQLTTVGKRATLWMNELLMDLHEVEYRIEHLQLLGSKGTTGTQASFLELFEGDHEKVKELERKIAAEMGFDSCVPVSGQTYSRKVDVLVLNTLAGIAQSASKFATDLRLLAHMKEIEEPFDRLLRHALQAQPHAQRAHLRLGSLRHQRRYEPGHHHRHPVVRAHPGRLRQQAPVRPRSVPVRGRHFGDLSEHRRRPGGA